MTGSATSATVGRLAAVVSLLAFAIGLDAPPAAAQASLDSLLAGLDDGCARTALFQAWQDDLVARHLPDNGVAPGHADVGAFAGAIGRERVVDRGEWLEVKVPLQGTWRGVPVSALVFSFGRQNGIYAHAVEFAAEASTVREVFQARVERSAARLAAEGDGDFAVSTGLDLEGRVALWCDFSN